MSLDNESIAEMLENYDKDSKALKKSIYRLCWSMRGGITLDELYQLSTDDRNILSELVKDNLEITKETKLPYF